MKSANYNDGVVKIYRVVNVAAPGDKPIEFALHTHTLRYAERTVGINRAYLAQQVNSRIRYLLRCPLIRAVSAQDVAVPNDGNQYRISMVQYPESAEMSVMDLTLEETTAKYEIGQYDELVEIYGGDFAPWRTAANVIHGGGMWGDSGGDGDG